MIKIEKIPQELVPDKNAVVKWKSVDKKRIFRTDMLSAYYQKSKKGVIVIPGKGVVPGRREGTWQVIQHQKTSILDFKDHDITAEVSGKNIREAIEAENNEIKLEIKHIYGAILQNLESVELVYVRTNGIFKYSSTKEIPYSWK